MKRTPSTYNILFDGSLGINRLVCAECRVPFGAIQPNERRITVGYDKDMAKVLICIDCQRQTTDWDDDPWG